MQMECPVCEEKFDKQGLENHMRLTSGRGHGPAGEMPPDPDEEPVRSADPSEMMVTVPMGPNHQESESQREEMPVSEVLGLHGKMLFNPKDYGIASNGDVRDLIEQISRMDKEIQELREAVVELTEAVELLADKQGDVFREVTDTAFGSPDYDGSPTVRLDESKVIRE